MTVAKAKGTSGIPIRAPQPEPTAHFQDLIHATAMARLEREVKDFIRSRPVSNWTEYAGNAGGYHPTTGKFPIAEDEKLPPEIEEDPRKRAMFYTERPSAESADRIYSRSAAQRYILQRLATELHGPDEVSRQFHSYETFKEALAAPESDKLQIINPRVVEPEQTVPLPSQPRGRSLFSDRKEAGERDRDQLAKPTAAESPHQSDAPADRYRQIMGGGSPRRGHESSRGVRIPKGHATVGPPNGTRFLNMVDFPNVRSDTFFVYR